MSAATVTVPAQALLAVFETAASTAGETEAALRKQMESEILRLERQRAFAFRRLNFMRLLSDGIEAAENEEAAVAMGCATVRTQLGWHSESETRTETLSRLTPVIQTTFACLNPAEAEPPTAKAVEALADFEAWYEARFGQAFWSLFEQQVEELPLVER
jgi:hypothetical protein